MNLQYLIYTYIILSVKLVYLMFLIIVIIYCSLMERSKSKYPVIIEEDFLNEFRDRNLRDPTLSYVSPGRRLVRLWIDVPTAFPWRQCLQVWGGGVLTMECAWAGDQFHQQQTFAVRPLPGEEARFQLEGSDVQGVECLGGDNITRVVMSVARLEGLTLTCSEQLGGYWRWSKTTGKRGQILLLQSITTYTLAQK